MPRSEDYSRILVIVGVALIVGAFYWGRNQGYDRGYQAGTNQSQTENTRLTSEKAELQGKYDKLRADHDAFSAGVDEIINANR